MTPRFFSSLITLLAGYVNKVFGFSEMSNSIQALVILLAFWTPIVGAQTCSREDGMNAESAIDNLKSWSEIYAAFDRYTPQCDDGGVAEGFSDRIVHLLASSWGALPELQLITNKSALFETFVLSHIDATADTNELRIIVNKSKNTCQPKYRLLCTKIENAAAKAIKEAETYEN